MRIIYAIIVTYNGAHWVDKCFGSLIGSSLPVTIIAIDNASQDGTPDKIRERFPQVKVIQTGENLGFGKANNVGIKEAYDNGADHFFLLNQDAWVEPSTIEKLVSLAEKHKDFGIVSPVHLNGEGTSLDYGFCNYLLRYQSKVISDLFIKSKFEIGEIYEIDFVNAAFWLLTRHTIETVGGFNPFFFQYGEDRDYVNRCNHYHIKVGFVPTAIAYHDRPQVNSDFKNTNMKRNVLLTELFDPRGGKDIRSLVKLLKKDVFKDMLMLRLKQMNENYAELRFYQDNFKAILEISNIVKRAGTSFL